MNKVWKNATFKGYYLAALALSILSAIVLLLLKNVLPPVAPLFYGRPSGEAQLVGSLELLIIPGVSILIILINFFIAQMVKDDFLKKILVSGALIVSILATITLAKIVFLVGFF